MRFVLRHMAVVLGLGAPALLFSSGRAAAEPINAGTLYNWVLLALNGGTMSINSMTSITGDVGFSSGVTTLAAAKAPKVAGSGLFDGATYVYSGAATTSFTSNWSDKDYVPNDGVLSGNTSGCATGITCTGTSVNTALDAANYDATGSATSLEDQFNTLFSAGPVSTLNGSTSQTLTGSGGVNLYDVSWAYNSNTLTLNGTANDWFIFRTSTTGNTWAQSQTVLNGVDPNHVWFYFTGDPGALDFTVNKDATVFMGNIFDPTGAIIYHNPATFDGRIIAYDITVHSDANIAAPAYTPPPPVPEPATMILLGTGLLGLAGAARRRRLA